MNFVKTGVILIFQTTTYQLDLVDLHTVYYTVTSETIMLKTNRFPCMVSSRYPLFPQKSMWSEFQKCYHSLKYAFTGGKNRTWPRNKWEKYICHSLRPRSYVQRLISVLWAKWDIFDLSKLIYHCQIDKVYWNIIADFGTFGGLIRYWFYYWMTFTE